jgi:hypothetical protein
VVGFGVKPAKHYGDQMATPTYREAAAYEMPFGHYAGKNLDDIAKTDRGLAYLGWLRDERTKQAKNRTPSANERETNAMLAAYLDEPVIAKELAALAGKMLK